MPNGKPGDHPYSDIIVHGSSADYGDEVPDLVRAMAKKPGFPEVRDEVGDLLLDLWPLGRGDRRHQLIQEALHRLQAIDARLGNQSE
jgi:hypothetical protein